MAQALVVDDSRAVRMILARTLAELGYEVRQATNGREALELIDADAGAYRLVLLDWHMPEMDGLELLRKLRSRPQLSALVVVMVTTETDLDHVAEALAAGANEYIMKPFTRDILIEKLQLTGAGA